jgi:hypothetical protein
MRAINVIAEDLINYSEVKMNNSNKKEKKLIQTRTGYLNLDNITSEDLRTVADNMDRDGIGSIEFNFDAGQNNVTVTEYSWRLETDEEYEERLEEEQKNNREKLIADGKEKQKLIIAARKLGLVVSNVNPILSSYDNVYWVPKGTLIEDWVVDKDGYIWYDEAGLLGVQKVYGTAKKANDALESYAAQCLSIRLPCEE